MPRVNVVLPQKMLDELDEVVRLEGLNRSKLLRSAIELFFRHRLEKSERQRRQADIQQAIQIQDELRGDGDSWDALKTLRDGRDDS